MNDCFVLLFFHSLFILFIVSMGNTESSEDTGGSPIIEAKSLLSNGKVTRAFAVLKEAAENGNVMACYDCGFMMIQGIGCIKYRKGGFELISKGMELEKESKNMSWKSDGSVSELFEPQSMVLNCPFPLMSMI